MDYEQMMMIMSKLAVGIDSCCFRAVEHVGCFGRQFRSTEPLTITDKGDITPYTMIVIALQRSTYDHRSVKTGHPVRSAIHKH